MSNYENPHDDDITRFEAWLGVTASAVEIEGAER
jgi:hypothetical protein